MWHSSAGNMRNLDQQLKAILYPLNVNYTINCINKIDNKYDKPYKESKLAHVSQHFTMHIGTVGFWLYILEYVNVL